MPHPALIDAASATQQLGVSRATLYAYVSRGLIRSVTGAADPRARLYMQEDVAALIKQRKRHRRPREAAATALDWGLPVLRSAITDIRDQQLRYRGLDAIELSAHWTLEQTALHLWQAPPATVWGAPPPAAVKIPARISGLQRGVLALALAEPAVADDDFSGGMRWMQTLCAAFGGAAQGPLHEALAQGWRRPAAADALRRALVLCADHELNASTFALRVVASSGADLCACLQGGLAALSGHRHGGVTQRLASALQAGLPAADIIRQVPGVFGHPLYPGGDPRATALLAHITPDAAVADLLSHAAQHGGASLDLALVALERSAALPPDAALFIFALGRSAGWIAHAFEQAQSGMLIRPRAQFVA